MSWSYRRINGSPRELWTTAAERGREFYCSSARRYGYGKKGKNCLRSHNQPFPENVNLFNISSSAKRGRMQ